MNGLEGRDGESEEKKVTKNSLSEVLAVDKSGLTGNSEKQPC